ncbi:hypothetical protein JRO89_XS01G0183100 [Xanthoceras sorbifolium]|uniref:Mitotic checkpoint serine/threonine-protein kinase BUB1 n=1 Tax=Xanthoceras sorbifolium TaxID=99658 RepID=A0ABQ8IJW0_9ROSI|nr:hypothetical protein JRO89_XS01G0183100 [Xanthoceras sorbifolium]
MAVIRPNSDDNTTSSHDPLLPWLWSIKKALDEWYSANHSGAVDLDKLLSDCISIFKHHSQYKNDIRFLKIWEPRGRDATFDGKRRRERHNSRGPRKPKVDFSHFNGGEPHEWLNKVEHYFRVYDVTGEDRVSMACIYLDGAITGGQSSRSLSQTKTERKEGLKLWLAREVKLRQSRNLRKTMQMVEIFEGNYKERKAFEDNKGSKYSNPIQIGTFKEEKTEVSSKTRGKTKEVRKLSREEVHEHIKKGLCFKCGDKWAMRRQCKSGKLLMIEDSGESASKDEDETYYGKEKRFSDVALEGNDILEGRGNDESITRTRRLRLIELEGNKDFEKVFRDIEETEICIGHSLLYQWYALFLEAKGKWQDAHMVYHIGISRKAEPLEKLEEAHSLFLDRMSERLNASSLQKIDEGELIESEKGCVNPWSSSTTEDLLKKINAQLMKLDGYHKVVSKKVAIPSGHNLSRNKIIELGGKKYQIKGCAGQGGFAQVFKAFVNCDPDDVVALKIQKPAFPWEFYMYRQLDQRISDEERSRYGFAHGIHLYSDCSILVCDYLPQGTLLDAINSYVVISKSMEEVLCIYYTIELLRILESLHNVGIIHGDFKPDNLLIRYARGELTTDGFHNCSGPWRDQGLCLVDWGKGIDLHLFPDNIDFEGDCRTSGFRCIQMQEKKPWKFQASLNSIVDTYGLCVIVHLMLHGTYLKVEKKSSPDGGFIYQPNSSFRRYWNVELWKNLFSKLLNIGPGDSDKEVLRNLRESFQDYMCSNPQRLKKLKELLAKQRASLCSA